MRVYLYSMRCSRPLMPLSMRCLSPSKLLALLPVPWTSDFFSLPGLAGLLDDLARLATLGRGSVPRAARAVSFSKEVCCRYSDSCCGLHQIPHLMPHHVPPWCPKSARSLNDRSAPTGLSEELCAGEAAVLLHTGAGSKRDLSRYHDGLPLCRMQSDFLLIHTRTRAKCPRCHA